MGRYPNRRHIAASPEQVFRGFTDPVLMADWMDMDRVDRVTGPMDQAGTRYRMVVFGPWRFKARVEACDPPRRIVFGGHAPLGGAFRMTAELTPRDGGTDAELLTEYTVPLGPVGRWIDRRWIAPGPKATANKEFDRLVEIAETAAREQATLSARPARAGAAQAVGDEASA